MKNSRGATLAETLVAASLGLLVLAIVVLCLWLSARFWLRADQTQTAQQECLTVQVRLQRDYRTSRFGSLNAEINAQGSRLAFLSYEPSVGQDTLWTDQGEVVWRKWVLYRYRKVEGRLERREVPLASPASKPDLTLPEWPATLPGTLLASHLTSFVLVQASPDRPLLHIRYSTQVGSAQGNSQALVLPRLYGPDLF